MKSKGYSISSTISTNAWDGAGACVVGRALHARVMHMFDCINEPSE